MSAIPGLRVLAAPVVDADLAALAAFAVADLVVAADLDVRLGDRSFGLHFRDGWRESALRGEPRIPGVVVCFEIARSLGLTLSLPLVRPR